MTQNEVFQPGSRKHGEERRNQKGKTEQTEGMWGLPSVYPNEMAMVLEEQDMYES